MSKRMPQPKTVRERARDAIAEGLERCEPDSYDWRVFAPSVIHALAEAGLMIVDTESGLPTPPNELTHG